VAPNELWCADYKGEFMLAARRYCYPLTISDFASRYLMSCEALATTQQVYAFTVFERVFKEFGMPQAIRTDNGVPFASPDALYGLSKLSVCCASVSASNASSPAIPSRTAVTSASI
jgi:putative transposase